MLSDLPVGANVMSRHYRSSHVVFFFSHSADAQVVPKACSKRTPVGQSYVLTKSPEFCLRLVVIRLYSIT